MVRRVARERGAAVTGGWVSPLLVLAGGAIGAPLRYLLDLHIQARHDSVFPWGTLAVNLAGCFLFGWIWSVGAERELIGAESRAILLVGFLGAFTTFSSFAFEGVGLLREGAILPALGHLIGQNVTGLLLVWVGLAVGRHG